MQRVAHDLEYIRRFSPWLDLRIAFGKETRQNAC
jgi:lipopolysaccharide/colanic/teichoic acid biosynthesis glycosyltransferase